MPVGLQLSQRLTQSLVLAPQLQQSLALLQAPVLELKALVEQELEQNPVLEEVPVTGAESREELAGEDSPAEAPTEAETNFEGEKAAETPVDDFQAEFDRLVQLDQEWRDHFSQTNIPLRQTTEEEEKHQFLLDSLTAAPSLADALLDQARDADLMPEQRALVELVIGNIDERGYFTGSVEELAAAAQVPVEQIAAALKVVQTFDPPGVGARDLRECLMLQLERAGKTDSLEYKIVRDQMEALSRRRIPDIARALECSASEVQEAIQRIGRLDPRPGRAFSPEVDQYVIPEVFVQKSGDDYVVSTNDEYLPHLRISNLYKDLMAQDGHPPEVKNYIREKIRAGRFLIKSLHQRQQTILNIAREIVNRQREFMDKGIAHLKPMTMAQIAEAVGVHETTVSRAVSGKYMQTPQGIFEMKFFFTAGLQTVAGGAISNTSVKDMIAEIFKNEDPTRPLSDQEVVKLIAARGITIARRTVAKYRDELGILPSNLRKVY